MTDPQLKPKLLALTEAVSNPRPVGMTPKPVWPYVIALLISHVGLAGAGFLLGVMVTARMHP